MFSSAITETAAYLFSRRERLEFRREQKAKYVSSFMRNSGLYVTNLSTAFHKAQYGFKEPFHESSHFRVPEKEVEGADQNPVKIEDMKSLQDEDRYVLRFLEAIPVRSLCDLENALDETYQQDHSRDHQKRL
jgi:hypothetical protein